MHVAHLSLADFRSYRGRGRRSSPASPRWSAPNGQGKTNLVEALGYLATLGSHRVATDAPLVRLGAERAVVRAACVASGRATLVELEITPGKANRARVNRSPCPAARGARPAAHRAVRARGPRAGQGRPVRAAPVPRRPAGRPGPALRRGPRGLRPRAQAAQRPAQDARRGRPGQAAAARHTTCAPSTSGTPTSPGPAPSCSPPGSSWSSAAPARRQGLRRCRRAASPGRRAASPTESSLGTERRRSRPTVRSWRAAMLRRPSARVRREELDRGSPWSGRTATTSCSAWALPAKGYASHGESWSYALALRLASYDLLRAPTAASPVLVLDDVFAELDSGRRDRLADSCARGRAGAGHRRRAPRTCRRCSPVRESTSWTASCGGSDERAP